MSTFCIFIFFVVVVAYVSFQVKSLTLLKAIHVLLTVMGTISYTHINWSSDDFEKGVEESIQL